MPRCAGCGQENPGGFRFCGAYGASLAPEAGPAGLERKVVTVLFCDLVGFTARSDQAGGCGQYRLAVAGGGPGGWVVVGEATFRATGRGIDYQEMGRLQGLYDQLVQTRTPRLVTIVGEPGVGKSRLVGELSGWLEACGELVGWRQGRCLAYGLKNQPQADRTGPARPD